MAATPQSKPAVQSPPHVVAGIPNATSQNQAIEQRQKIAQRWADYYRQLRANKRHDRLPMAGARKVLSDYRALEHDLTAVPEGRFQQALQSVYLQTQEVLLEPASNWRASLKRWIMIDVPASCYALRREIALAVILFLGFAALGALLVHYSEELAGLFMGQQQMEQVRAGKVWTDSVFSIAPAVVLSFNIMLNNILVSLFAFVIGAIFGLGTLYILATNGLMLGALFAFCYQYGVGDRLLNFIPAHGVVELFVICVAAACGLHLGDSLVNPGARTRVEAFQAAIKLTMPILLFGCAGLVICGLIEGYISPNPAVPFWLRVAIGFGWFGIFFAFLSGLVWRKSKASL